MRISVIIPALNEAGSVGRAVESATGAFEVIVADGGSIDSTRAAALSSGASVIAAPRGRGVQMDAGALSSRGDALVFLHADTLLPASWKQAVEAALKRGAVGGGFRLAVESPGWRFRILEAGASLRSRVLGLIYGDQVIFASRAAFFGAGGFGKLPLMEDVDCVNRLRRFGRVVVLRERVVTSARRWEARGILGNTLWNWTLLALWALGVSPERLHAMYYGDRGRPG